MKILSIASIIFLCQVSEIFSDKLMTDWISNKVDGPVKVIEKVELIFTPDTYSAVYLPLKHLPYLLSYPRFNLSRPTIFYFHGWMESGDLDLSVLAIRGAYMDRDDHNVVTINWSYYAKNINYRSKVIPQMKVIGESFADYLMQFIKGGYEVKNIHLVGHSLGGQMVGKISRELKKISDGKILMPRIFALDPAGPGFGDRGTTEGMEPISRNDAKSVQIIHTCAGQLGMLHRVGTIDFYPNGGLKNPGCNVDVTSSIFEYAQFICDHARSWHFYQLTVRNPKAFPAVRCNSHEDFMNMDRGGNCWKDDIAFMGFGANSSETGKYFLETNGNMFNLSRGFDGTRPTEVVKSNLPVPVSENYVQGPSTAHENMILF